MKKTISMLIMGIFLLSIFPFVSADNEIQLGEPFQLALNEGAVLNNDINPENGDILRLRVNLQEIVGNPGGAGEIIPSAEIGWMLTFNDNEALGMAAHEYLRDDTIDVNRMYVVTVLNVNWDEGETARFAELRVDRFAEMEGDVEVNPPIIHRHEIRNLNSEEQEEYSFSIIEESSQNPQIIEKQEALGEVVLKLKDYIRTTKQKIQNSNSFSEEEKVVFIKKLNERNIAVGEYLPQIVNIKNSEEVKLIKSKLKAEIKEIKPIAEKPSIKIHKDKISKIIDKLGRLPKKLEKITSSLDTEDKNKVKELKSLIKSANKNINKAKKLYNNGPKDTTEIKFLLRQATKDIKEAFRLINDILSNMESNILYAGLDNYEPKEKSDNTIPTTANEATETPSIRAVSGTGNLIENIYINLNEPFKLYVGQSSKLIDEVNDEQKSVIITLKNLDEFSGVGINVNYWEWSDHIGNQYDILKKNQNMIIGDYTIKVLAIDKEKAKFIVQRNYEVEEREDLEIIFEVGDTIEGVTLIGVDANGNSCTIEYDDLIYTINTGSERTMGDGTTINVKESIPSNRQATPDYCELKIEK